MRHGYAGGSALQQWIDWDFVLNIKSIVSSNAGLSVVEVCVCVCVYHVTCEATCAGWTRYMHSEMERQMARERERLCMDDNVCGTNEMDDRKRL